MKVIFFSRIFCIAYLTYKSVLFAWNDFPSSWVSERHELCDSGDRGPDVVDVLPHHLHHGGHVYHGHRKSLPQWRNCLYIEYLWIHKGKSGSHFDNQINNLNTIRIFWTCIVISIELLQSTKMNLVMKTCNIPCKVRSSIII